MNKILLGLSVALALTACHGKSGKTDEADGQSSDSSVQAADTLDGADGAELDFPENADELFDDFIFNFASNKRLQINRIAFPLPYTVDGKTIEISRAQWKHDHLFSGQDYYTMIFDNEQQMEIEKDTSIRRVDVQWLYLAKRSTKTYRFARTNGAWMLKSIDIHTIKPEENADFLAFYHHFVSDSVFQRQHVAEPIKFVTTDSDDDFEMLSGTVDVDQWFLFRPELPAETLTNIDYGQHAVSREHKILVKKGVSDGMMDVLTFRFLGGEWRLVSYEN